MKTMQKMKATAVAVGLALGGSAMADDQALLNAGHQAEHVQMFLHTGVNGEMVVIESEADMATTDVRANYAQLPATPGETSIKQVFRGSHGNSVLWLQDSEITSDALALVAGNQAFVPGGAQSRQVVKGGGLNAQMMVTNTTLHGAATVTSMGNYLAPTTTP